MNDRKTVDRRLLAWSPTAALLRQLEIKTDLIIMMNGSYSTCKLFTSEVLQTPVLRPVLFNIHIKSLEEDTKFTLVQFVENIKLWHTVNIFQEMAAIQRSLDSPDEWEDRGLTIVREDKCTW